MIFSCGVVAHHFYEGVDPCLTKISRRFANLIFSRILPFGPEGPKWQDCFDTFCANLTMYTTGS